MIDNSPRSAPAAFSATSNKPVARCCFGRVGEAVQLAQNGIDDNNWEATPSNA
jgi:hypothetical protein